MPTFGRKYDRDVDETQTALEAVIGKEIKSVRVSGDVLRIAVNDGAVIEILDDGQSCCERRHMSCDDDLSSYVGATILRFELADGPEGGSGGDIHETQFLRVHTTKDLFTVVNHNEHNGYYGGFSIVASLVKGWPMTTTDEVTHLRALLAEQTARAERAEAEADHLNRLVIKARTERDAALAEVEWERETLREAHASTCSALGLSVSFGFRAGQDIDAARRVVAERDQALAACAEMRAALERALGYAPQMAPDHRAAFDAILARPDLGRDCVVVLDNKDKP